MGSRLFDRLTTLIRADAHGVVDALEARDLLLRQYLREAELALVEKRARIDAIEAEDARLAADAERMEDSLRALDEDVELALTGGKDELARFAIRRLLPERAALRAISIRREDLAKARGELAAKLADQEAELAELQREAGRHRAAEAAGFGDAGRMPPVTDEEVELELMRRRAEGAR